MTVRSSGLNVDGDVWIHVTQHAYDRFHLRADRDRDRLIGPRVAWFEATIVIEPIGVNADEARYHGGCGIVLLRKGSNLVTVIDDQELANEDLAAAVDRLTANTATTEEVA